jgi:hypothetical protein
MCTLLAVVYEDNPTVQSAIVADRTNPTASPGYSHFRAISSPRGNPAAGSQAGVYAISEAWLHKPAAEAVFRAQAFPAKRPSFNDFGGSAWSVNVQDATGAWSPAIASGTANSGNEADTPAAGGATVPQLMAVGVANPQMFACAGGRSQDNAVRTTWLLELMAPDPARSFPGGSTLIQDLLNGDDRFVPSHDPTQPQFPPAPKVSGPRDPGTQGSVQCAMTQSGDDVTTRQLHMVAVGSGSLYYSVASAFAPVGGDLHTPVRFSAIAPWIDLGRTLGGPVSPIVNATIVASRPDAISILFVAQVPGGYRIFHTVRLPAGTWRTPDDVLLFAAGGLTPLLQPSVAAGMCPPVSPVPEANVDSEIVYTFWDSTETIMSGRIASTALQFSPGLPRAAFYSPLTNFTSLLSRSSDPTRNATIHDMRILTRPFSDTP